MNMLSSSLLLPRHHAASMMCHWSRALGTTTAAASSGATAGAGSGFPQKQQSVRCKSTAAASMRTSMRSDNLHHLRHHENARGSSVETAMPWFLQQQQQQHQTSLLQKPNNPLKTKNKPHVTTSMHELIQQAPLIVQERKEKDIAPGSPEDPVIQMFRHTHLSVDEWSRYAFFDSSRPYTRNLIATDNETYTLLLLCWNPQHESPIHDHPCDGCWLQVLQGTIQECRYSKNDLSCISDQTFGKGQIAYITDNMGYHKIGNPSTENQPAVSLHLYAPPIQQCRTWRLPDDDDEDDNDKKANDSGSSSTNMVCQNSVSTHYSEYGFRVDPATTTTATACTGA